MSENKGIKVSDKNTETVVLNEKSFEKEAFLKSDEYKRHRDLINTILQNEKKYTKKEVNRLIDKYLKGGVK